MIRNMIPLICLVTTSVAARADDWPQFLGPKRDGMVRETGLNWDWKANPPKTLWKVPLGSAFSSLTIVGDRIYTLAKNGPVDGAVCLDANTGKVLWTVNGVPSYTDQQKQGSGPRATPTYHNGKLYCLFARGELWCLDTAGKKMWEAHIFKDTGTRSNETEFRYWGVSLSPIVEGDLVIVQPGVLKDEGKNNSIAAYHKDTGKLMWMTGSDPAGYSSPIAIDIAGSRQIVVPTGQSIIGLNPTKGEILWRYTFGNQFNATCATPVWHNNQLYVSAGYGAGNALLELVQSAGKWIVREVWKNKNLSNLMANSMIVDGHIYGCHGEFAWFMRCLDLKTGGIKWEERLQSRQSLLYAEGHLISLGERGSLTLVEARPDRYSVKAELPNLLTFKSWAIPALANGKLYLRDEKHLLCLDLRKSTGP